MLSYEANFNFSNHDYKNLSSKESFDSIMNKSEPKTQ